MKKTCNRITQTLLQITGYFTLLSSPGLHRYQWNEYQRNQREISGLLITGKKNAQQTRLIENPFNVITNYYRWRAEKLKEHVHDWHELTLPQRCERTFDWKWIARFRFASYPNARTHVIQPTSRQCTHTKRNESGRIVDSIRIFFSRVDDATERPPVEYPTRIFTPHHSPASRRNRRSTACASYPVVDRLATSPRLSVWPRSLRTFVLLLCIQGGSNISSLISKGFLRHLLSVIRELHAL